MMIPSNVKGHKDKLLIDELINIDTNDSFPLQR